jgi:hypothetical protein
MYLLNLNDRSILLQRNNKNLERFANCKNIRGFEYKYGFLLTKIKP